MSGYSEMFKETLSPCYSNIQKKGWHGGKSKKVKKSKRVKKKVSKSKKKMNKKKQRGGSIATCQSTVPAWHARGHQQQRAADISYGRNIYQFTRTLPNGKLFTAFNYGKTQSCGPNFPEIMPKVGGGRKGVKMTIGRDGKKYFFKNGKRIKNIN